MKAVYTAGGDACARGTGSSSPLLLFETDFGFSRTREVVEADLAAHLWDVSGQSFGTVSHF